MKTKKTIPPTRGETSPKENQAKGFYARGFQSDERCDLQVLLENDLQSEIDMLRVLLRRSFEQAGDNQPEELAHTLSSIGLGVTRLAGLLRVQQMLGGDRSTRLLEAIQQALRNVTRDMELSL